MSRPIDADALKNRLTALVRGGTNLNYCIADMIDRAPTIEPEDRCGECDAWNQYKNYSRRSQWIPCSERLPKEEKESYWVCTDGGYQHECRWTNTNPLWTHLTTNWHWNIFDIPQYSKVVAWMPLPEPYRGEGD